MPLANLLQEFDASLGQCDKLIASAHRVDANGAPLFPKPDQQQITVAAFLNMFIAWETFLESSIAELLTGEPVMKGGQPVKYASPLSTDAAHKMLIGVMKYFDFGNHENFRKIAKIYFDSGYPYEQPLSSIISDLNDLRAMRNAAAHITTTTQIALDSLAIRIFGQPQNSISLYQLLTSVDPRSATGETVYLGYRNRLQATATLIARG